MQMFKIGSLKGWQEVETGLVAFDAPAKARAFCFDVMAAHVTAIYAQEAGSDPVLVAVGDGHLVVEFTSAAAITLSFEPVHGDQIPTVFLRTKDHSQLVPSTDAPKITKLHYGRRQSSDLERMQRLMMLNERDREERIQRQLAAIERRYAARVDKEELIEDEPAKPLRESDQVASTEEGGDSDASEDASSEAGSDGEK